MLSKKFIITFWILVALYISAFTIIPHIYMSQWSKKHPELVWTGAYGLHNDVPTYFTKMIPEVRDGLKRYNFYTHEQHEPDLVQPVYVVLGYISQYLSISIPIVFLFFRIIVGTLTIILFFYLLKICTGSEKFPYIATSFLVLGGGLGNLLLNNPLIELTETYLGLRLLTLPHQTLGGLVLFIALFLLSLINNQPKIILRSYFLAGCLILLSSLLVPLYNAIAIPVALVYTSRQVFLAKTLKIKSSLIIGLSIFLIISNIYLFYWQEYLLKQLIWRDFVNNNYLIQSPNLLGIFLSFIGFIIFIFFDFKSKNANNSRLTLICWLWIITAFIASIIGLVGGTRYLEGVSLPFSVLAASGFITFLKQRSNYLKKIIIGLSVCVLLVGLVMSITIHYEYYRNEKNVKKYNWQAYNWLNSNTQPETILVFPSYKTEYLYAPYFSRRRIYYGHWGESVRNYEKFINVQSMYKSGTMPLAIKQLIKENSVCFFVFSKEEQLVPEEFLTNQYVVQNYLSLKVYCEKDAVR